MCLSDRGIEHYLGRLCYATGFGNIKKDDDNYFSYTLKQIRIPLLSPKACKKLHSGLSVITQLCAGWKLKDDRDTSYGDSGGPIVCLAAVNKWHLVGITSYGEDGTGQLT